MPDPIKPALGRLARMDLRQAWQGEATEFTIDLWDIAHTFEPNHRIRLEISSSNFPRFDRNLNSRVTPALGSAEDVRRAVQQVFHDGSHPSRLDLPIADS